MASRPAAPSAVPPSARVGTLTTASTPQRRIFQVTWGFDALGGLEHHLTELALALHRYGDDVLVFTEIGASADNAYIRRLRAAGIPVSGAGRLTALLDQLGRMVPGPLRHLGRRVLARSASPTPADATTAREEHPVTRALLARLDAACNAGRPDVIHVHGIRLQQSWVVRWAAERGIATVYTEHVTLDEWHGAVDQTAIDTIVRHSGAIACVSERARQSALTAMRHQRDVAIVRHAVSGARTAPPLRADGPLQLLCLARLERYKGIDILLKAAALAESAGVQFTLRLAGDGTERRTLMALSRTLGLRSVTFLGSIAPESVATELRNADLMVLPSRGEGLPVAVVEAMAHARPVLATRAGGTAEAVQDGITGLLVDAEAPAQLAAAIAELAADRPRLQRMAEAAHAAWQAGGWSPEAVRLDALALYRGAADRATACA